MSQPYGCPEDVPTIEESEAVAAAQQARYELLRDGPAPSVEAILREMGRDADGRALEDGPTNVTASEAARRLLPSHEIEDKVFVDEERTTPLTSPREGGEDQ